MSVDIATLQNGNMKTGSPPAPAGKSMGKEDFMKLLLTQLSAQDPMNPQDSTAFVGQLTQFANLEGLDNLGKKMDQLVSISGASNAANAVSLLGKDVRIDGNKIKGSTTAYYQLSQQAQSVKVDIRDKSGAVVKSIDQLPGTAGLHEVKITDLPAGEYTFSVTAFDSGGKALTAALSIAERVKGVSFADNMPQLLMESGTQMKAGDVVEIRQPGQGF